MYDLNEDEFQESLSEKISPTIYLEVESIEELSAKANALVGRRYELEDEKEGYYISDIRQIVVLPVTEFYVMPEPGSTNLPIPHTAYHAIVLPVWEHFFPNAQERDGAKIVAD